MIGIKVQLVIEILKDTLLPHPCLQRERNKERETERQIGTQRHRERDRERLREKERDREIDRERLREIERDREIERQRGTKKKVMKGIKCIQ